MPLAYLCAKHMPSCVYLLDDRQTERETERETETNRETETEPDGREREREMYFCYIYTRNSVTA